MTAIGLLLAYLGAVRDVEALVFRSGCSTGSPAGVRRRICVFLPAMRAATAAADRLDLPEARAVGRRLRAGQRADDGRRLGRETRCWAGRPSPTLDQAIGLYGNVLVIGATVSARSCGSPTPAICHRRNGTAHNAVAAADTTVDRRRQHRQRHPVPRPLPPHLGRDLIALEMEDHYVRAHTAHGSTMILLRMRDAVAELDGIDGAQVHRSWWVARAAVTGVRREGRNVRLRLGQTLEAPVARANVSELEGRGWL